MAVVTVAAYHEKYDRQTGRGDLFEPLQKLVLAGQSVPVDFHVLCAVGEKYPFLEAKSIENFFDVTALDCLVDHLNGAYNGPTDGKLQFKQRAVTYHVIADPTGVLPLEEIGVTDPKAVHQHLTVRLLLFYGNSRPYQSTGSPEVPKSLFGDIVHKGGARYKAHGLIDIDAKVVLQPQFAYLLPHEVGHGILGFDHHDDRQSVNGIDPCLMNHGILQLDELSFCAEDNATLARLAL
jgi:hypothetical protein